MSDSDNFISWPQIAAVEIDRYCEHCGYNLRQQPVRRHVDLGVLLCRCPECGRVHAAGHATTAGTPWFQRLAKLMVATWIVLLVAVPLASCLAEGGIIVAILDELTWHRAIDQARTTYVMQVRPLNEEDQMIVAVLRWVSCAIGFIVGFGAVVCCPHWRRPLYYILVLTLPLATGTVMMLVWRSMAPHLLDWGALHVGAQVGMNAIGGLIGVAFGRPLARGIVLMTLPPKLRATLSGLWLADGLRPPGTATDHQRRDADDTPAAPQDAELQPEVSADLRGSSVQDALENTSRMAT